MLSSVSFGGSDLYFEFVSGGGRVFDFALVVGVAIFVSALRGTWVRSRSLTQNNVRRNDG